MKRSDRQEKPGPKSGFCPLPEDASGPAAWILSRQIGHSFSKLPINVWKRPTRWGVLWFYVGRDDLGAPFWLPHWGELSSRQARLKGPLPSLPAAVPPPPKGEARRAPKGRPYQTSLEKGRLPLSGGDGRRPEGGRDGGICEANDGGFLVPRPEKPPVSLAG